LVAVNEFLEEKYVSPRLRQGFGGQAETQPLERDVRILLSIHDEIILEVREGLAEKIAKEVKTIMENVVEEVIPLKVDAEIGKNWGEI